MISRRLKIATRVGILALVISPLLSIHAQNAQMAKPDPPASPAKVLKVFDTSLIDKSVDPCENFYKYSCNAWFAKNPLPKDQVSYGRFTELSEVNRANLRAILEAAAVPSPSRSANEQKIGDEYASCMDVAAINAAGTSTFQPELDRIAALHDKVDKKNLPLLLAHMHAEGVNAFFSASSDQDFADSTSVIASFNAGTLGLPERDYYTRTDPKSVEQRQQYVQHVANMFKLLGEPAEKAASDAATVLALETRLAKASFTVTEERDPQNLNHPSTFADFGHTLSSFDLATYFYNLAPHVPPAAPTQKINVMQPKYFAEMNSLVADTDLESIRTFLRWQLIHALAGTSTPESFDNEDFNFYGHILHGQEQQQPRWKRCTRLVDRSLGEALGQVYVAKYFPPSEKQRTLDMAVAIEAAMDKDIDSLDWMSPATRVRAKEKLHSVANKIGYPDRWRDYSTLQIKPGDALGNELRSTKFENDRQLAKIGKTVDRGEWAMTPPTVNAYYNPQLNDVNFPAGYLQPPFFSGLEDDAANYGDMGSTIGHELTHGFDDEGRQFDAKGNLADWWAKEDADKFTAKSNCMVKQFDAYVPLGDVHINGKLTLGENLADLGGLWLTYLAWEQKAQTASLDLTAKAQGYTPEQRFYVAYAQQWCTQTRPEAIRSQLLTDPHSPDEYRTNGILQDFPEFAAAFHCKKGSAMVPATVCRVW